MITKEEAEKIVLGDDKEQPTLYFQEETEWGYIFHWGGEILGYGAALVDKDSGLYFQVGSRRKKQNVVEEFGRLMVQMRGQEKQEKSEKWMELYNTFDENPYF